MSAHILIAGYYIFITAIIPIQFIRCLSVRCAAHILFFSYERKLMLSVSARTHNKTHNGIKPERFFHWIVPSLLWNVQMNKANAKKRKRRRRKHGVRVKRKWEMYHQCGMETDINPIFIYSRQTADKLCICGRIEFRTATNIEAYLLYKTERAEFQQWNSSSVQQFARSLWNEWRVRKEETKRTRFWKISGCYFESSANRLLMLRHWHPINIHP